MQATAAKTKTKSQPAVKAKATPKAQRAAGAAKPKRAVAVNGSNSARSAAAKAPATSSPSAASSNGSTGERHQNEGHGRRLTMAFEALVQREGLKPREVYQPLRVALCGSTVSPGIFESVALLGREETLRRIDAALARA